MQKGWAMQKEKARALATLTSPARVKEKVAATKWVLVKEQELSELVMETELETAWVLEG